MATFTLTKDLPGGTYLYVWTLTSADATGDSISHPGASDKTVELEATAAGSATCALQGTNDPLAADGQFKNLHDGDGQAIAATAGAIELVAENPLFIRPKLTTAGIDATWVVRLLVKSVPK